MADENERFAVDVGDFVETLLERQKDFEAETRKKQDAFEAKIRGELRALDEVVKCSGPHFLDTKSTVS